LTPAANSPVAADAPANEPDDRFTVQASASGIPVTIGSVPASNAVVSSVDGYSHDLPNPVDVSTAVDGL
jgi:hypothetical protein